MIGSPRTAGGTLPPLGRTMLVGLLLVGLALVGWVLVVNRVGPLAGGGYVVEASFRDAGGIKAGDGATVTIAGVDAGRVVGVTHRSGVAVLRLRLDDDTKGRVHRGATATVRPRSQLGDLIVELTPGRLAARALRDGDRLDVDATAATVPFSQVVATLDSDTRTWLQLLVGELDRGVGGDARGRELRRAMRSLEPLSASASSVTAKLAARRATLTRLVRDLDVLFSSTGRRGDELRRTIVAARQVLGVTGDGAADVRATVAALPATLASTRRALASVGTLGDHLDPALATLRPLTRELPRTLRTTREALPRLDGLLAEASTTARTSTGPARDLEATTRAAGTAIPALRPTTVRGGSIVRDVDRNRDGIGLLGERFSGIFSTADQNGTLLRGLGFFEPFNPANFGFGDDSPAGRAKAATAVVRATLRACRTNAFACLLPFTVPGLQTATNDLLKGRAADGRATDARTTGASATAGNSTGPSASTDRRAGR
ncbi:MlaD family protein [Patulibacter sp.]|uniref:MlaD family protein n=1 Tax=Patulibacter sp. TaxID=1912859 RepID=UPI002725A3A5|nr:MlaD family protein [Patulibacter sp.]MDO9409653.1 MlaD family protein [Patulibacter sp.]